VFQGAAVAHDLSRRARGQSQVPPQPGDHRLLAVVLRGLGEVCDADPAGQQRVEAVTRLDQLGDLLQLGAGGQRVQVVGGERVQRRCQLAHDTSRGLTHIFDQVSCISA
jgi:hypothetical protein